jgi:predicted RNase H-like HicB family nuclease
MLITGSLPNFGQEWGNHIAPSNFQGGRHGMRTFSAVIEKCPDTGLYVGYVPGFPGAHTQAESLDELQRNLREVIEMLLEDGEPAFETEFVGTQVVVIA